MTRYLRRNRNCLPEIAPQGHFLALRAQGATGAKRPRNDKFGGIAPLNLCRNIASLHGAHYPQGARRIRKAAKPPTAAQ